MHNCFSYTYKTLTRLGYKLPTEWNGYTTADMKRFIVEYREFLDNNIHIEFFDSFCDRVDKAKENDIIVNGDSIGIAIDHVNYMTIYDEGGVTMRQITKDSIVFRIGKTEVVEGLELFEDID